MSSEVYVFILVYIVLVAGILGIPANPPRADGTRPMPLWASVLLGLLLGLSFVLLVTAASIL